MPSPSSPGPTFSSPPLAVAALTGLLFVSISINLSQITRYAALPGRAIEAIMILVTALAESLVTLIPGQSAALLGIEILVVALAAWGSITAIQLRREEFSIESIGRPSSGASSSPRPRSSPSCSPA